MKIGAGMTPIAAINVAVYTRQLHKRAWVNRSSRLRTAVDLKSYGKGRTSLKVNSSGEQKRPCFSIRRFAPKPFGAAGKATDLVG